MGKYGPYTVMNEIQKAYNTNLKGNTQRVCKNIFHSFGMTLPYVEELTAETLCIVLHEQIRKGVVTIGDNGELLRGNNNIINNELKVFGAMFAGNTRINKENERRRTAWKQEVGVGSFLRDCEVVGSGLGEGVIIEGGTFTKIDNSQVEEGTVFFGGAKVRYSRIGERNEIGQIEIVRSTTGKLMKALHWGFLGDAELGDNINVSNFFSIMNSSPNGKKGIVRIGDNVFLGGASTVVSGENGITIGDDAVIAAGATVLKDVPAGYIYISKDKMYPKNRNLESSK